jgi:hypothetical protein
VLIHRLGTQFFSAYSRALQYREKMRAAAVAISTAFDAKIVEGWRQQRDKWHETHEGIDIYAEPVPGMLLET